MSRDRRTLLIWLSIFAVAMAQVEAAVVVHLRSIYYLGYPPRVFPLELLSLRDLAIELVREASTVAMILAIAFLSCRGFIRVFAAFVYVFGLWDIFYYVWLKLMIDWPVGWLEWDVLFLIPWPWVGPWPAPAAIALMFVLWGLKVLADRREYRATPMAAALFGAGVLLALAAFLAPTAALLPGGATAFAGFVPEAFPWWLYGPGVVLMGAGLVKVLATAGPAAE